LRCLTFGPVLRPCVYDFTPRHYRDGPEQFLADCFQADAFGGYNGLCAGLNVIRVACWAHAWRKFCDGNRVRCPGVQVEAQVTEAGSAPRVRTWLRLAR
jgi:Transposase IS66 family